MQAMGQDDKGKTRQGPLPQGSRKCRRGVSGSFTQGYGIMRKITYKDAGVDINKANLLVGDYKRFASKTKTKGVISNIGSFGALFRVDFKKFKDPILVSSTHFFGTKLKI